MVKARCALREGRAEYLYAMHFKFSFQRAKNINTKVVQIFKIGVKFTHLNLKDLHGCHLCNCQRMEIFPAISAGMLMSCIHTYLLTYFMEQSPS